MDDKILHKAIGTFGKRSQVLIAVEEMVELQKELLKDVNRNKLNMLAVLEEIADVCIMIEQLKIIYTTPLELEAMIHKKLTRLEQKITAEDSNL